MNFKYLTVLGAIALLTVSCGRQVSSYETETQPTETSTATQTTAIGSGAGTFQKVEHTTEGTVRVVSDKGKQYLEFDRDFKTDFGPDLFVVLLREDAVPKSGIKEKDYVNLARLQKTSGTQRYEIPANVKLSDYKSVGIWCRAFNVTFGYAPLRG